MIGDPGVEEKDKGPNNESGDNGDLAEAFARQADLKDDGGGEIQNEEKEVGCVAERAGGGEEPDRPSLRVCVMAKALTSPRMRPNPATA
jgi:hypothetical protein